MDKIMRNGVVDLLIQLSMQFNIDTETMIWVVFAVGMTLAIGITSLLSRKSTTIYNWTHDENGQINNNIKIVIFGSLFLIIGLLYGLLWLISQIDWVISNQNYLW